MHPIARIAVSLAAGGAVVFLIDRFIWPGTLVPGSSVSSAPSWC